MKKFNCKRPQSGFTLVEVLMVVLIISVLAGMVLGIAGYANKKAAYSKAEAELQKLGMLFEEFRLEEGYYPGTYINWTKMDHSSVNFDVVPAGPEREYYEDKLAEIGTKDPWLTPYEIKIPNNRGFLLRIRSLGEDGAGAENDSDASNDDNLEFE